MLEAALAELRAAEAELKAHVSEFSALCTLQRADLARLKVEQRRDLPAPNTPSTC